MYLNLRAYIAVKRVGGVLKGSILSQAKVCILCQ